MSNNYWKPLFKWQYVEWFVRRGILTKSQANSMNKKQLMGKYYELRKAILNMKEVIYERIS